ncbi:MAG: NHL repeat-containing protein [Planctomycetota bacterium]|nr:NHL repeat-containing protein [Planctomycetota bacterium]
MLHSPSVLVGGDGEEAYVTDVALRRIQKFGLQRDDRERLRYVRGMSRLVKSLDLTQIVSPDGKTQAQIDVEPDAMVRDEQGTYYLLDSGTGFVTVIDSDLHLVKQWGGYGDEPGKFRSPTDITLDESARRVFVVDRLNYRIQVFDLQGDLLFSFGEYGTRPGQLLDPFGIALDSEGRILVSDTGGNAIHIFDHDGAFIESWGSTGSDEGQLYKPRGIVVGDDGRVLVSDYGNHRIQIFDASGKSVAMLGWRKPRGIPNASEKSNE